jgi:hypothetical protein
MKSLFALLLVFVLCPAFAQPGPARQQGERHQMQRDHARPMPPPERRMSWEDRERLREQVRSGNMTRDEARERWREQREQRGLEPGRSPEERQQLRRDVQDANRDLEKR